MVPSLFAIDWFSGSHAPGNPGGSWFSARGWSRGSPGGQTPRTSTKPGTAGRSLFYVKDCPTGTPGARNHELVQTQEPPAVPGFLRETGWGKPGTRNQAPQAVPGFLRETGWGETRNQEPGTASGSWFSMRDWFGGNQEPGTTAPSAALW